MEAEAAAGAVLGRPAAPEYDGALPVDSGRVVRMPVLTAAAPATGGWEAQGPGPARVCVAAGRLRFVTIL